MYHLFYWTSSNPDTEYSPFVITLTLLAVGFVSLLPHPILLCHILYIQEILEISHLHWHNFYQIFLCVFNLHLILFLMDTTFFTLCNGKVLFLHLNNGYEVISYFVAHQLSVSFTSFQNNLSCFPCRCYRLFLRLFVFVMDRFKRQHSLSSVRIRHPKYFTALDLDPQLTVNTEKMYITIHIKA